MRVSEGAVQAAKVVLYYANPNDIERALTAALPYLPVQGAVSNTKIEAARKAVEELANTQMNLPLEDWSRISSAILSALEPSETIETYYARQIEWSKNTFGPALRTLGILDHIRKELKEIEAEPHDLSEWIDVVILAMDGFWRHGGTVDDLMVRLLAKQQKNMARTWPDWRTMSEDAAIEHDRTKDAELSAGRAAVLEELVRAATSAFNTIQHYAETNVTTIAVSQHLNTAIEDAIRTLHPVADKPDEAGAQGEDVLAQFWRPISEADRTITYEDTFNLGDGKSMTIRNSDHYWVRDADGRVYEATWSDHKGGYWWDLEGESRVDPVEYMPHPLSLPSALSEGVE